MTKAESEPETLYSAPFPPSPDDARAVLAFLFLPARVFCDHDDDSHCEVCTFVEQAQRHALEQWYAQHASRSS